MCFDSILSLVKYIILLYRHERFTGTYTTRKIHKNYIPDRVFIFHNLTSEFIDDAISVISLQNL